MKGMHVFNVSIQWKMTLLYTGLLVALLLTCGVFIYLSVARFLTMYVPHTLAVSLVEALQWHLLQSVLLSVFAASIVALIVGLWVARHLLRPIAAITATAGRIRGSGDLSQRIPVPAGLRQDEVGVLASTFNTMLEQLEKSFKAQQQFIADANHELKTPVTAILGHANLLRRRGKAHPELLAEATTAIIEEGERMHHLILDLLRLAAVGSARIMLQEAVSLEQVSQTVVKELRILAQEQKISLIFTSSGSALPAVLGDQQALKQLVTNLVENALKWTPAGGSIQVVIRQERQQHQVFVVLEVCDTGCGIATEELPHIFGRFYRVEKARTRDRGGSGLGLAIVQEIVASHRGYVVVQSEPDHGSLFSVFLPSCSTSTPM